MVSESEVTQEFSGHLGSLAVWAAVASLRARDLFYEWLALGAGFGGFYLYFVIYPKLALNLIDAAILVAILGTAIALARFERQSQRHLKGLSIELGSLIDSTRYLK